MGGRTRHQCTSPVAQQAVPCSTLIPLHHNMPLQQCQWHLSHRLVQLHQAADIPHGLPLLQATAFWAIEHCYNLAWQLPGPMPAPYDEFAQRWGNEGFSQYVVQLQQQADEALQAVGPADVAAAQEAVQKVAVLEVGFWDMAYSAAGSSC
jgi:thiaminase